MSRDGAEGVNQASTAFERLEGRTDWPGQQRVPLTTSSGDPCPAAARYKHPKKKWRLKRGATPQWYKQRAGRAHQGAVGRGARGALQAAGRRHGR
jgi:sec-independent protein translocase protein TatB